MRELEIYYRRRLTMLVGVIVTLAIAYQLKAEPWLLDQIVVQVHWIVKTVGSVLAGALFLGGEWLIRRHLWRLESPELDLSGDWVGESQYEAMHIKRDLPGQAPIVLPFTKEHSVSIRQDCFSVAIAATAEGFHKWNSIVMTFRPPDELEYAYSVTYLAEDADRFPKKAVGFEQMKITGWEPLRFGRRRPRVLKGDFSHCAMGQTPVYSGTVTFTRKSARVVVDGNSEATSAAVPANEQMPDTIVATHEVQQ